MSATQIKLSKTDGWWIATDLEVEVTTQARSRAEALEKLDDAVALHDGDIGRPPTNEELEAIGITPENNATGERAPPDVLE